MWRTGCPVKLLMAVPVNTTPEPGDVTEDKPNWFQSCVPANKVVVVGTLSCVTFCAFAAMANIKKTARQKNEARREIDVLPARFC
jgi:hypothetical protein